MRYLLIAAFFICGCEYMQGTPDPPSGVRLSGDTAYVRVSGQGRLVNENFSYNLERPGAKERKWLDAQGYYFGREQLDAEATKRMIDMLEESGASPDPERGVIVMGQYIYIK